VLLGVCVGPAKSGGPDPFAVLSLQAMPLYCVPSDNVVMTCAAASPSTGRCVSLAAVARGAARGGGRGRPASSLAGRRGRWNAPLSPPLPPCPSSHSLHALLPTLPPTPSLPPHPTPSIFLGGADGNLYELTYAATDSWRQKRCAKVRASAGGGRGLLRPGG
jgi:hypothetical protein